LKFLELLKISKNPWKILAACGNQPENLKNRLFFTLLAGRMAKTKKNCPNQKLIKNVLSWFDDKKTG
jgi:hypothetical protein